MSKISLLALSTLLSAASVQAQSVQSAVAPDVWSALQFCSTDASDGLYHFKTSPCPSRGWVPSPSLTGLAATPSPFPISEGLQPSWGTGKLPPSSAPDVVGAFRFIMRAGGTNNDDVLVYPGQCGKSPHLHQYFGRNGWNCLSTYENMRATAGQPGNDYNGFKCLNCSGYWEPAMLDGAGNLVKPNFVAGYYKRRPVTDPKCGGLGTVFGAEGKCVPIPNGLRMIFGYDFVSGKSPTGELWFNCQGPTAKAGHYSNLTLALANCPAGNQLGAIIEAPNCWDGKNLDSPNHRDHVAYMVRNSNTGQVACPVAHPYRIVSLTLGAWFPVAPGMHLSCDMMLPNAPSGTCFHGDYFENWAPEVKAMWEDNCINKMRNASGGDLCNGLQLKGAQ